MGQLTKKVTKEAPLVTGKKKDVTSPSSSVSFPPLSGNIIRESMIEEYVLHLQKTMNLSNERTRQLMSFFLLQFMLKNIQTHDFILQDRRILRLEGFSPEDVVTNGSYPQPFPCLPVKPIVVIPMQKKDFIHLDFEKIIIPTSTYKDNVYLKNSTTSYDMWTRYIEQLRSTRCFDPLPVNPPSDDVFNSD